MRHICVSFNCQRHCRHYSHWNWCSDCLLFSVKKNYVFWMWLNRNVAYLFVNETRAKWFWRYKSYFSASWKGIGCFFLSHGGKSTAQTYVWLVNSLVAYCAWVCLSSFIYLFTLISWILCHVWRQAYSSLWL